jgi:hypothetical protein
MLEQRTSNIESAIRIWYMLPIIRTEAITFPHIFKLNHIFIPVHFDPWVWTHFQNRKHEFHPLTEYQTVRREMSNIDIQILKHALSSLSVNSFGQSINKHPVRLVKTNMQALPNLSSMEGFNQG